MVQLLMLRSASFDLSDPGIDRAKALLDDFAQFWEIETEPSGRRKPLLSLFEQVWPGRKAASSPCNRARTSCRTTKPPGAAALGAETSGCQKRERRGSRPRLAPHRNQGVLHALSGYSPSRSRRCGYSRSARLACSAALGLARRSK